MSELREIKMGKRETQRERERGERLKKSSTLSVW